MCCYVVRDDIDPERLARVLAGEETEADAEAVRQWAAAHPAHARELELLESGMQPSGRKFARPWRVAEMWSAVERTMQPERPRSEHRDARFPRTWPRRVGDASAWRPAAAGLVAGIVVALSGTGVWLWRGAAGNGIRGGSVREYHTAAGERATIMLPDGTRATLAPASRLRVPAGYAAGQRTISLDGEAFFSVVHDERHPFAVHAANAVATDVGTAFDVRVYDGDARVRVVVAAGRVVVRATDAARRAELAAGDAAEVSAAGQITTATGVDVAAAAGWVTGRLTFEKTPVRDVVVALSRWYGVPITLADPTIGDRLYTATLTDLSASATLQAVGLAARARVVQRDGGFVLSPFHEGEQ